MLSQAEVKFDLAFGLDQQFCRKFLYLPAKGDTRLPTRKTFSRNLFFILDSRVISDEPSWTYFQLTLHVSNPYNMRLRNGLNEYK